MTIDPNSALELVLQLPLGAYLFRHDVKPVMARAGAAVRHPSQLSPQGQLRTALKPVGGLGGGFPELLFT